MQVHKFGRLNLYGRHPLERDTQGKLICSMAAIFPGYQSMIVGTGLHVTLAQDFMDTFARRRGKPLDDLEQEKVYEDLVAVMPRGEHVVIRSRPDDMEKCFRAGELLEEVVPAEMIRYTGRRDPVVRNAFKLRGESWKMTPKYFTYEEIARQIELSLLSVGTENRYYYNLESGGRLITFQQFESIGRSLADFQQFSRRVSEVVELYRRKNVLCVREVDFFMAESDKIDFSLLEKLDGFLKQCKKWDSDSRKKASASFRAFLRHLKEIVPPEFQRDDPNHPVWRNYMYSKLNDIPPTEESILGMSEEFNMNIRWLPGCRIKNGKIFMHPQLEDTARDLLFEFFRFYGDLEYINLGEVMRSQSQKRAAGTYREVYIVLLRKKGSSQEQIRMLRKVLRNTIFFLNRGFPLETAERMAEGYIQYTRDRREVLSIMGVNTPPINRIGHTETLPGIGMVAVDFFERPYIPGLATDKVSSRYYENEEFVRTQARLLGGEAAMNLIVGRSDPNTGRIYFGDGDELLQFEKGSLVPTGLVLADFTGAFADVVSPFTKFAAFYEEYLVTMLNKSRFPGVNFKKLAAAADLFIDAMHLRLQKTRQMLLPGQDLPIKIMDRIKDRDPEVNAIRIKVEKIFQRFLELRVEDFVLKFQGDVHRKLKAGR